MPKALGSIPSTIEGRKSRARHRWLMPITLATQEAEIRKIRVQSQPRQIIPKTLSQKNPLKKKKGLAQ
jgi:hypothetical protein